MIRKLFLFLVLLAGAIALNAEARVTLVTKSVKWQNEATARTAPNGKRDTTYLPIGTAIACTTMAVDLRDLAIPSYPQYGIGGVTTAQGDSSWTIGRVVIQLDSTSVGTVTSIQLKVDGIWAAAPDVGDAAEPADVVAAIVDTFVTSNFTAARVYSIPIKLTRASFSTAGNAAGTFAANGARNLLFFPDVRFIVAGKSGTGGKAKFHFVHYADVP